MNTTLLLLQAAHTTLLLDKANAAARASAAVSNNNLGSYAIVEALRAQIEVNMVRDLGREMVVTARTGRESHAQEANEHVTAQAKDSLTDLISLLMQLRDQLPGYATKVSKNLEDTARAIQASVVL
jgi:hypothetical protein